MKNFINKITNYLCSTKYGITWTKKEKQEAWVLTSLAFIGLCVMIILAIFSTITSFFIVSTITVLVIYLMSDYSIKKYQKRLSELTGDTLESKWEVRSNKISKILNKIADIIIVVAFFMALVCFIWLGIKYFFHIGILAPYEYGKSALIFLGCTLILGLLGRNAIKKIFKRK